MIANNPIAGFNDLTGVAALKSRAADADPKALKDAARQFEALFLQMMLKSMRDAGAAFSEDRDRSYEEMFDQQIAIDLADQGSIGIADLLMRQIGAGETTDVPRLQGIDRANAVQASRSTRERENFTPSSPREFVENIWPLANKAAQELGVDPRGIVAQAVLETGWGEKLIRDSNGVSGNNLFGIKTGNNWPGERIAVQTLEHSDGRFTPQIAQFRAYPTLAEGFAGYAEFLQQSPRYQTAIERGTNPEDFAVELQQAGYATDPNYAEKIRSILDSPQFTVYLSESPDGD